jgi:hypothetical protein
MNRKQSQNDYAEELTGTVLFTSSVARAKLYNTTTDN